MAVHAGVRGPGHLSRTFGWSPSQLGASLLGWWDAEDASTITQSGGLVSSWRDKVAAYDAVQATGASKPVYSATSFNNRAGLEFDGTDDELTAASVSFPTGTGPVEIWLLGEYLGAAADTANRRFAAYGGTASTNNAQLMRSSDGTTNTANAWVGTGAGTATAPAGVITTRHVLRAVIGTTSLYAERDGSAGAPTAAVPAITAGRFRMAANTADIAGNFSNVRVSAILVSGLLAAAQATQLTAYLKARGGIA